MLRGAQRTIGRLRPLIAETREKEDGMAGLLRDLGYRRIPVSLAHTPTYLYAPSLRSASALIHSRTLVRLLRGTLARRLHIKRPG